MNTKGHGRSTHKVGAERRCAVARLLDEGVDTIDALAERLDLTAEQVRNLIVSMMYHFRIVANTVRGQRHRVARYRLTVPLDAALEVMGGAETTSARDAFYALDRAMPMPSIVTELLALKATPRLVVFDQGERL